MSKNINTGFLAKLKNMLMQLTDIRTEDGRDIMVDGDIEVGKDVLVAQDGEYVPAPNGEYKTGELVIVVEAGKITEVRKQEAEPPADDPNKENLSKQQFAAKKECFEKSYEERTRMIAAAIIALGYSEDGYVVEASDSHAVWCYWDEATGDHFVSFTLVWDNNEVTASNPVEVVPSFKPKDETDPTIELRAERDRLKAENEGLKANVAELEQRINMAAVPPAEQDLEKTEKSLANKFIENARARQ